MKFFLWALCWVTPCLAQSTAAVAWPDTYVARLEALALVETLNVELLSSRSATLTLERWCREHRLAEGNAVIVAVVVRGAEAKAATTEQRQRLQVTAGEDVRYRRVQLRCGEAVLSEADNWYVPGRLTAEMNRLLESTDTPFGKVVLALEPYRRTFLVQKLWHALPDGWEMGASSIEKQQVVLAIPQALFEHRAVLYTRDNLPFSEVDEVYQRQVLGFQPPPVRGGRVGK